MSSSSPHSIERASFGLACWSGHPGGMTLAHRHDDLEFNLADVDLEYVIDGRPRLLPAGTVAVFWAARPHRLMDAASPRTVTWLTVPLGEALAWRLPAGFVARMLRGEVLGAVARDGIRLDDLASRWQGELADGGVAFRIARTEIEAFVLRMAKAVDAGVQLRGEPAEGASPMAASPNGARRGAAGEMAAFVSERYASEITVTDVAAHVHLNPQYAMTLFRSSLGITIGDYLAHCRVAAAQQLLLETDLPVVEVGFAVGFRSQSQFYDRFSRWCGRSPAAYRRSLRTF